MRRRAVRVVRLHAQRSQCFTTLLEGDLQLGAEPGGCQGVLLDVIEALTLPRTAWEEPMTW
jgi:hypothetical protein